MEMHKMFEDSLKEIPALREKFKGNNELEKAVDDAEHYLKDLIEEVKSDERIS